MEFEKQNNFEEEWRKAFESASMTPSDELWGRIESELEKKKKRPFIFFLKPSLMATGLAAALALVLGGILFFNQEPKADIAQNTNGISGEKNGSIAVREKPQNKIEANKQDAETLLAETAAIAPDVKKTNTTGANSPDSKETGSLAIAGKTRYTRIAETSTTINVTPTETGKAYLKGLTNSINDKAALTTTDALAANTTNALNRTDKLEGKKYRYLGSRYTMQRNKLAFDPEMLENDENTALASNDSKFWVGLQSGIAPFDPNMKLGGINSMAYSAANDFAQLANGSLANPGDKGSLTVSKPQNVMRSGIAINNGVAFGYKVSKKWHIESGVRYLRGNSTLETNTYAFQNNGYVNTFLTNYLLQNSAKEYSSAYKSNTVVADASAFGNRYEYLMVPMQMAYEIGLTKKLGLNLLAGISTDIFLQNSITTDNGLVKSKNTISGENRIYKPVNFSGLGGVRATYLISKHWQANIGTSYQRALFSGMTSSVDLNMRPQMFGLNYGFNYRF